jgi:hypothetical protein
MHNRLSTFTLMKYFAIIISCYILGLAASPALQIAHAKFSAKCHNCCAKKLPVKETKDCDKRDCPLMTCCYNSLLLFITETKYTFRHHFFTAIENNFKSHQVFISYNLFDIWHPPKL